MCWEDQEVGPIWQPSVLFCRQEILLTPKLPSQMYPSQSPELNCLHPAQNMLRLTLWS